MSEIECGAFDFFMKNVFLIYNLIAATHLKKAKTGPYLPQCSILPAFHNSL